MEFWDYWPFHNLTPMKTNHGKEITRMDKESIVGPFKKLLNDVTFYSWNIQKLLFGYYFVFMLMFFNNEHNIKGELESKTKKLPEVPYI